MPLTIVQFKRVLPGARRVNTRTVLTGDSAVRLDMRVSSG